MKMRMNMVVVIFYCYSDVCIKMQLVKLLFGHLLNINVCGFSPDQSNSRWWHSHSVRHTTSIMYQAGGPGKESIYVPAAEEQDRRQNRGLEETRVEC